MKAPIVVKGQAFVPFLAEYPRGKSVGYDNDSRVYGRYYVVEYCELVFGELVEVALFIADKSKKVFLRGSAQGRMSMLPFSTTNSSKVASCLLA